MHSVNKSRVTEIFEVRNGQIVLNAVEFETFGAGMPTELEPGQTMTRLAGGVMRIDGFNRTIYDMQILVGQDTDHMLHIGDLDIPLKAGQIILKIERN
jgi:hypothetical protein